MRFHRPLPIDKEISLNNKKIIVSKTDKTGKILYANKYFFEVTGYELREIIGHQHNILRHPDMPQAIFYLMWQTIQHGDNITAIVKNLAKSGKYYWVTTDFEIQRDGMGKIESYMAFRRPATSKAIEAVEELYERLLHIEKRHGMEASLVYLKGYLDERNTTYPELMDELVKPKSFMERIFSMMKKRFQHSNNDDYTNSHQEAV